MKKLTIADIPLKGKRVFVRADFNVPLDELGNITDDTRIRAVLPTINYALDKGADRVIVASHLGRPKGKVVPALSLKPVVERLQRLLKKEVKFIPHSVGPEVEKQLSKPDGGEVFVLENLRFHAGEGKNEDGFARQLAAHADVYVNDAFATAHRSHASNVAITRHVPVAVAGYLMHKEIRYFEEAVDKPTHPFVAILGGAKVSDKIGVIKNLLEKVDKVIIGGGMAFTFLRVLGFEIGKSLVEEEMLDTARDIMRSAKEKGVKFYLPVDCVVADKFDPRAETKIVTMQEIPREWMALDVGPATSTLFNEALQNAKTIIWNGPMGVFEMDAFSRGTMAMVNMVANSYALTIVGGGDTDVAVHRAGESYKISYISTGGGAFLHLLEGKDLPGLTALSDKDT